MMGSAASGALDNSGKVVGILPQFLFEREPPHPGVSDMRVVQTMHERKALMYELSDGFIALPGGFGTMEEAMEVITWRQLSLHDKPIVFLSEEGFWSGVDRSTPCSNLASFVPVITHCRHLRIRLRKRFG